MSLPGPRVVIFEGRRAVRCPNQDCDQEDGCCICEYSGWIDADAYNNLAPITP
jgi:hypothetical protein